MSRVEDLSDPEVTAAVPQGADTDLEESKGGSLPLPRPARKRRRSKEDRGLPDDGELLKLAQVYLETQKALWPDLAGKWLIPDPSSENLAAMVEDFKHRHRQGKVSADAIKRLSRHVPNLGGGYFRFSCDNSNPLSISDQMVNCLRKAREQGSYIPWEYIFADFSVTGLSSSRPGYSAYKQLLSDGDQLLQTTFIDDFSRASRDDLEWWKLAHLSRRLQIGLIGASDGFDLSQSDWDMKVTLYALFSRLFIKQLREKVRRGMSGAARRGTCLGKLSLGFTRKVKTTADGSPFMGSDGNPIYVPCHDPMTVDFRREMFDMFVRQNLSAYKIAQLMNQRNIDGWTGWTGSGIKKLLWSPSAVGIFIWNQNRNEYDIETEKQIRIRNPRKVWEIHIDRQLAIVEIDLWKQARRKLGASRRKSPLTGKKQVSRNQQTASTLFSGTLFCGYCNSEIVLQRSSSQYKQLGCLNGWTHVHGCELSASKSTKVIEECLLSYLRDVLLVPKTFSALLSKTNAWIEQEAAKPRSEVSPLKAEREKIKRNIAKWTQLIERSEDPDACATHSRRISQLEKELKELDLKIREAQPRVHRPLPQITKADLEKLVLNLREVLNSDIPVAASAIRELTGPILIRQVPYPDGKRGAKWIATFTPNFLNLLQAVLGMEAVAPLRQGGCALDAREVRVEIEKIPKYVKLAAEFKRLAEEGASIQEIALIHGMSWKEAQEIANFAMTGVRPKWKGHGKGTGSGKTQRKFVLIADQVVKLHEEENLNFAEIARRLSVGEGTVLRAYNHLRPGSAQKRSAKRRRTSQKISAGPNGT